MDKRSLTERDICTKFVLPAPSYRAASGDLPPFGYGLGQCSAKPAPLPLAYTDRREKLNRARLIAKRPGGFIHRHRPS
jgi:hypothetical protein